MYLYDLRRIISYSVGNVVEWFNSPIKLYIADVSKCPLQKYMPRLTWNKIHWLALFWYFTRQLTRKKYRNFFLQNRFLYANGVDWTYRDSSLSTSPVHRTKVAVIGTPSRYCLVARTLMSSSRKLCHRGSRRVAVSHEQLITTGVVNGDF